MDGYEAWAGSLEIRQLDGARELTGVFPYGATATMSDRGRTRKERFRPRAFSFAIDNTLDRAGNELKIDLLRGHNFDQPIASRQAGTLQIVDADDAVRFTAQLPPEHLTPVFVADMEKLIANGQMTGLSPGFRVPPPDVVARAEYLTPEPGNPGVMIREIASATLREFSVVSSGSYRAAGVSLRSEDNAILFVPRSVLTWL